MSKKYNKTGLGQDENVQKWPKKADFVTFNSLHTTNGISGARLTYIILQ